MSMSTTPIRAISNFGTGKANGGVPPLRSTAAIRNVGFDVDTRHRPESLKCANARSRFAPARFARGVSREAGSKPIG